MNLSTNFTLEELTATGTRLKNVPTERQKANIQALVNNVLQPVRDLYGHPIYVNSGFRSKAVNEAVGGAADSQHCLGEAADLDCADNARLFYLIREHLPFDQLIWEGGDSSQPAWVHVSFKANRKEVLKMKKVNGKPEYEKIS